MVVTVTLVISVRLLDGKERKRTFREAGIIEMEKLDG